jgi:uncharacterized protein (DUF4415 family)
MKKTTRSEDDFDLSRAKIIPRHKRREMPPEAFKHRNIKVRVNMYLDLDVIEFFKKRATKPGAAPYQTQINAELRRVIEEAERPKADPVATLRQASRMINSAAGQLEKRRPA